MNTLQKKYCITTENRVITHHVYRSYMKMSLKLTGYSEVPRSQAYWIYASVDCSPRHMLNARGGVYATNTLGSGPSNSHFTSARVVSLEVSAGQTQKHTQAFTGHPCAPVPTLAPIPTQILLQKAWKLKSLFGFKHELWNPQCRPYGRL